MTTPTDAELLALNAGEVYFSESPTKYPEAGHGTQYHAGAPGVLQFARAILTKWGQPQAVAGGEPLTEVQRNAIYDKHCFIGDGGWEINWWQVIDEVEAAHGITKGGQRGAP